MNIPEEDKPTTIDIKDWQHFARTYTPHPVAALFPMLPPEELEELATDICANGLIHPIVLDDEMRVVDGRNRLAAMLLEADSHDSVRPRFVRFWGIKPSRCADVRDYIISTNIRRRHLTDAMRAMITAQAYPELHAAANKARSEKQSVNMRGNSNAAKTSRVESYTTCFNPAPEPRTWEKVAEVADVSQHKARQALTVVSYAPDLADKVVSGDMSLHAAAKIAKDRKAESQPKKKREPKYLPLRTAMDRIRNVIADMLGKLSDEDMQALRAWVDGGCK